MERARREVVSDLEAADDYGHEVVFRKGRTQRISESSLLLRGEGQGAGAIQVRSEVSAQDNGGCSW